MMLSWSHIGCVQAIVTLLVIYAGLVSAQEVIERSFQYGDAFNNFALNHTNATCFDKQASRRSREVGCVCAYGLTYSTQTRRCEAATILTQGCDTRFIASGDPAIQLRGTLGLKAGFEMSYCGGAWCLTEYIKCDITSAFYDNRGWKQLWKNESHQQDFTVEVDGLKIAKLKYVGKDCGENAYNGMLLKFNLRCDLLNNQGNQQTYDTCGLLRVVGRFEVGSESVLSRVIGQCGAYVSTAPPPTTPTTTPIPTTPQVTVPVVVTLPPTTKPENETTSLLGGTSGGNSNVSADKAVLTTVVIVTALAIAAIIIVITIVCRSRMKRKRHRRLMQIKALKEQENKRKEMFPSASAFYIQDGTDSGIGQNSRESTLSEQCNNQPSSPSSTTGVVNAAYTPTIYDEPIIPPPTGDTNAIYAMARGHPRPLPYCKSEPYLRNLDSGQCSVISEPALGPSRRPRSKTDTPLRYRDKGRNQHRRQRGRSHNSMDVDESVEYMSDTSRQHARSRSRPRSYPSHVDEKKANSLPSTSSDSRVNPPSNRSPRQHRRGRGRNRRPHDNRKRHTAPDSLDSQSLSSYQSGGGGREGGRRRHRRKDRGEPRRYRRRHSDFDDEDDYGEEEDDYFNNFFDNPWHPTQRRPEGELKLRARCFSSDMDSEAPISPITAVPAQGLTTSDEFILPSQTLAYMTGNDNIALNARTDNRRPWAPTTAGPVAHADSNATAVAPVTMNIL